MSAPLVTIDGPSGAGKGAIAGRLARLLGWHLLDSGALYRVTAHACALAGGRLDERAAEVARRLHVSFTRAGDGELLVRHAGADVSRAIRTEECGRDASTVAAIPAVRQALLSRQRDFLRPPGLVADGRDMGTVVFPRAPLKFFLTASARERAARRHRQLLARGVDVSLARLLRDIEERDERDRTRAISCLAPAADAVIIDSTAMAIGEVLAAVMASVNRVFPELPSGAGSERGAEN